MTKNFVHYRNAFLNHLNNLEKSLVAKVTELRLIIAIELSLSDWSLNKPIKERELSLKNKSQKLKKHSSYSLKSLLNKSEKKDKKQW